ncbi:type VI secretion system secreted protein Hcp [Pseudomonas sp. CC120222-01a]|nr:type VI secretion system secreted protein Hcp [Pseudomonas sp. CC120222-01a]
MAFDAFIQIAEIAGESQDEQYKHWIEVLSYTFGTSQSTSATASSAGGATSGRTTLSNLTFTKSAANCSKPVAPGST